MRITIVSRIFAPEPGAASFRLRAVAQSCAATSHDVTVLTSTLPHGISAESPSGLEAVKIKRANVLRDRAGYVRGYAQYMSFDIPLIFRLLFAQLPDVVLAEPPPTTGAVVRIVCAVRRIPYAYYAADIWSDASRLAGAPGIVVTAVRRLELFAMAGARRILSVSEGVTQRLQELGISKNVHTVGNGSDLTAFSADGEMREIGSPYFVYTGTASEVHGAIVFAQAFAQVRRTHPEATLVYVGQGSEFPAIEKIAESLPEGAIRVFSRTGPAAVADWLRGATAALASVKPGGGYDFAFPTKMYAATSCGVPVLYAGFGPGRRFIGEIDYGVATDYDVDSIAASMRDLLDNDNSMADRARVSAWARENVDIAAVADRVRGVLDDIARGQPTPSEETDRK